MASVEGNRKIAKIRKNFGQSVLHGKIQAGLKPSELKIARYKLGITQATICKKLGYKQATLASIETGKRPASLDKATNISNLLGKKIEDLFKEVDGKYQVIFR